MKKGDLSINMIIVAAIALIILVIIAVLIFGMGNDINTGTSCTGAVNGICIPNTDSCSDQGDGTISYMRDMTSSCPKEQICCIKAPSLTQ